jgi:integrase
MTKRRGNNEGTIWQCRGRWRAQVRIDGGRISKMFDTQQQAREWVRNIQNQKDQGLTYDNERITLRDFMEGWLQNKKLQVRLATYEQYSWTARTYIIPTLGSIKLRDLSSGQIQGFYDRLAAAGKGTRTIKVTHIILHGCLERAKQLGLVLKNSTELCTPPPCRSVAEDDSQDLHVWDEIKVGQFLNFMRGQKNENLYHLALTTGMRRGELLGLQWKDIDWNKCQIQVRRECFHPVGGGFVFQSPKTKLGKRTIQLGQGVIDRLRAQQIIVDELRKKAGEAWNDHDLVFPSHVGTPLQGDRLTHEFPAQAKAAGLPVIRFHDCRHTAATIMLSHGIPPVIVAGMLGHSISILMNTYTHFIPTMQSEAAQLMSDLFTPIQIELKDLEKR